MRKWIKSLKKNETLTRYLSAPHQFLIIWVAWNVKRWEHEIMLVANGMDEKNDWGMLIEIKLKIKFKFKIKLNHDKSRLKLRLNLKIILNLIKPRLNLRLNLIMIMALLRTR